MIERWLEEPAYDQMSKDEHSVFMECFSDYLDEQADLMIIEQETKE